MSIEEKIFRRYSPNFEKFADYGFSENNGTWTIEKLFKDDLFKAVVSIGADSNIHGTVFDLENDDEFLPLRVENNQGAFVAEVRTAYEELLEDIREHCFIKKYFIYPQSNRITNMLIAKYGDEPEFLWEKTPGTGIFRNPETNKWYLAILDIDRSKIQAGQTGLVEVINLKLAPEHVEELLKQENFYPAYHMNKKYWLTLILDDSVSDEKVLELIEESHSFTEKKKRG